MPKLLLLIFIKNIKLAGNMNCRQVKQNNKNSLNIYFIPFYCYK